MRACVCVYVSSHLLQSSRYLLALQQVGRLQLAADWRSLDMQLQLGLGLLLHQQLLPQLLHHLFLHEEDEKEKRRKEKNESVTKANDEQQDAEQSRRVRGTFSARCSGDVESWDVKVCRKIWCNKPL